MARYERNKGTGGELEVAHMYRAAGFDCDRVPNSGGLRILGDLYGSVPEHVEVKRQETARPWTWWEQASAEAPDGVAPVVAFRRSRSPWLALTLLERHITLVTYTHRPAPRALLARSRRMLAELELVPTTAVGAGALEELLRDLEAELGPLEAVR